MADDLADLAGWIGRTREREDVVTPRLVDAFRATLAPHLADVEGAPLGLHWCLAPDHADAASLGPDGHAAKGDFLPPVPLPRRMWAGGEVSFHAPLRVGDAVVRRSTVRTIAAKPGRSGRLCFVTVEHAIANRAGPAIAERHVIVYREAVSSGRAAMGAELDDRQGAARRAVAVDPVLLFRYSALTFNGHRIHYDAPYATGVEGYPGLVIHGPLQATLLLNHAATVAGRAPRSFSFKAVAPACGPQRLTCVAAAPAGERRDLRMLDQAGAVTMEAVARW